MEECTCSKSDLPEFTKQAMGPAYSVGTVMSRNIWYAPTWLCGDNTCIQKVLEEMCCFDDGAVDSEIPDRSPEFSNSTLTRFPRLKKWMYPAELRILS